MFGVTILAMAIVQTLLPGSFPAVGNYWIILASAMLSVGHLAALMGLSAQLYGIQEGYRVAGAKTQMLTRVSSLEAMLGAGSVLIAVGIIALLAVLWQWTGRQFTNIYNILPAVIGTTLITIGFQTIMGGFLISILGGNAATFLFRKNSSDDNKKWVATIDSNSNLASR